MSKRSIQFAGVLILLAALFAVSAQENTTALNNATINNTTLLNNTTLNASVIEAPILPIPTANETAQNETVSGENESAPAAIEIIPAQNETVPVQNATAPTQTEVIVAQNETGSAQNTAPSQNVTENVTVITEPIASSPVLQPGAMQIGSPQRTAFAIGGIGKSPNQFSIDGKALARGAYEFGLPAKTIMDLSALPFFVNKI
jgi:hypothetical protein